MSLTEQALRQFTGTATWYHHGLVRKILYTEGVKYVADEGGAHWLLDLVATNQMRAKIAREQFQAWKLVVAEDTSAVLTCDDGDGNIVHTQKIDFTTFPLPEIQFWVENNVIYLPSER